MTLLFRFKSVYFFTKNISNGVVCCWKNAGKYGTANYIVNRTGLKKL